MRAPRGVALNLKLGGTQVFRPGFGSEDERAGSPRDNVQPDRAGATALHEPIGHLLGERKLSEGQCILAAIGQRYAKSAGRADRLRTEIDRGRVQADSGVRLVFVIDDRDPSDAEVIIACISGNVVATGNSEVDRVSPLKSRKLAWRCCDRKSDACRLMSSIWGSHRNFVTVCSEWS